jgi:predicted enzyme related to lactoylglutathione lyase
MTPRIAAMLTAIDHVILPAAEIGPAAARFEQLGLRLTPPTRHAGQGTENRVFFAGNEENEFYVELLAVHDEAAAREAGRTDLVEAIARGGGLWRVMLETTDIESAERRLGAAGVAVSRREVWREGGAKICDLLFAETSAAGASFAILQYAEAGEGRRRRHAADGAYEHSFPLKRLDHLAAIVHDLDAATDFWTGVLAVPVFGEVPMGPGIIRQLKVGDAIFELIGPAAPDSPIRARPEGLISMCAFEVADLRAAVESARTRGFSCGDPAPGPLPGTRVASIPAAELSGMTLQLLESRDRNAREERCVPNPVVSFEIRGRDPERLRSFYARTFEWDIELLPGGYAIVATAQHVHDEESGATRYSGPDAYLNEGVVLGSAWGQPAWKLAGEQDWRPFEPGIGGGIGEGAAGVSVYIQVPDLDSALTRVVAHGGTILRGPVEVAPGVVVASFADPEGNQIGLLLSRA